MTNWIKLDSAQLKGTTIKAGDIIAIKNYNPFECGGLHGRTKIESIQKHVNPRAPGVEITDTRGISYSLSVFENYEIEII